MRKPPLDERTVDSLEALVKTLPADQAVGTAQERGVRYLLDLVKHYRGPAATAARHRAIVRTKAHKEKQHGAVT